MLFGVLSLIMSGALSFTLLSAHADSGGKKVIEVLPMQGYEIALPDGTVQSLGSHFEARLKTFLIQSGKYVVYEQAPLEPQATLFSLKPQNNEEPTIVWSGTSTPAARISMAIKSFGFFSGSRGNRVFYGFDESDQDATRALPNEFGINSFDSIYRNKGKKPKDALSGLDIGEGFSLNFLFAFMDITYRRYASRMGLEMSIDFPLESRHDQRQVRSKGKGYYFDFAVGFEQYEAEIQVVRRDAVLKAFEKLVDHSLRSIHQTLDSAKLTATLDKVLPNGVVLLGTGQDSNVPIGTLYEFIQNPAIQVEVIEQSESGSIGRLVHPEQASLIQEGDLLREPLEFFAKNSGTGLESPMESPFKSNEELPVLESNLGKKKRLNFIKAFFKGLAQFWSLPYKIWRYKQTDQKFKTEISDQEKKRHPFTLAQKNQHEPWVKEIGLLNQDRFDSVASGADPVVAVIDTGVDYNHALIHDSILPGFDFLSNDARAYDDHFHGTEAASLVLAVAPFAKIIPIKMTSPFGQTTSRAVLESFLFAIKGGAKIILAPWATRRKSQALEQAVSLCEKQNVVIVTSAGESGLDLGFIKHYPASYSSTHSNVLAVSGLNAQGLIDPKSNFSKNSVQIAAPSTGFIVADPRNKITRASTPSLAAAVVAGALARLEKNGLLDLEPTQRIQAILDLAKPDESLKEQIKDGLKLRVSP